MATRGYFLLQVPESTPGDYNQDGNIDAADYVVWRKTDGTQTGYDTWRAHFDQGARVPMRMPPSPNRQRW